MLYIPPAPPHAGLKSQARMLALRLQGCGQEVFDKELSHVSLQARADALNRLLSRSSIQLLSLNHQLVYKELSQEDAVRCGGGRAILKGVRKCGCMSKSRKGEPTGGGGGIATAGAHLWMQIQTGFQSCACWDVTMPALSTIQRRLVKPVRISGGFVQPEWVSG
eukprot:12978-Chlamydomonas_euryale.AAC.5